MGGGGGEGSEQRLRWVNIIVAAALMLAALAVKIVVEWQQMRLLLKRNKVFKHLVASPTKWFDAAMLVFGFALCGMIAHGKAVQVDIRLTLG